MLPAVKMNTSELTQALSQSKVASTGGGQGGFLKVDFRTGDWSFGAEQEDVTGDTVVINTPSIGHGWVLWADRKATKVMARFNEPLPEPMPPQGDNQPSEGRIFQGVFLDAGTPLADCQQFTFETNSYGGRAAVDSVLEAIKTKAMTGSAHLFPAVKLTSTSYVNKKHGSTIYNPVFDIIGWYNEAGEAETQPEAVEDQTETASKEAESAPTRRRRRAA